MIKNLLWEKNLSDSDYLFQSRRHRQGKESLEALTVPSLSRLVKQWCADVGLVGDRQQGGYAAHTLRKTWGYHHFMENPDPRLITASFNHNDFKTTLRYLDVTDEELKDYALSVQLGQQVKDIL